MRFSKAVVKYRVAILIVALVLLAPAVLGMVNTRINYDMLDYLPEDMDTVIGQNELLSDFGKGAFSLVIVEDMPAKDVAALKEKIAAVEHVDSVVWYDSLADLRLPMELLPDSVYHEIQHRQRHADGRVFRLRHLGGRDHGRHPADSFAGGAAVLRHRHVGAGHRPEGSVREGGARVRGAGRAAGLRRHDAPSGQLAGPAGLPVLHRREHRL